MNTAFKRTLAAGAITAALPLAALPASAAHTAQAPTACRGGGAVPADGQWHHYQADTTVTGYYGYRQLYRGNVDSIASLVAIQLKSYENGKVVWAELGAHNGPWTGRVAWGDAQAKPEIRAIAIGTDATITFTC